MMSIEQESTENNKIGIRQRIGLILGPGLFLIVILFADLQPGKPEVTFTEAIPIPATSLLPLVILPFCGIMPGKQVVTFGSLFAQTFRN